MGWARPRLWQQGAASGDAARSCAELVGHCAVLTQRKHAAAQHDGGAARWHAMHAVHILSRTHKHLGHVNSSCFGCYETARQCSPRTAVGRSRGGQPSAGHRHHEMSHTRAIYGAIRDGRLAEAVSRLQGVLQVGCLCRRRRRWAAAPVRTPPPRRVAEPAALNSCAAGSAQQPRRPFLAGLLLLPAGGVRGCRTDVGAALPSCRGAVAGPAPSPAWSGEHLGWGRMQPASRVFFAAVTAGMGRWCSAVQIYQSTCCTGRRACARQAGLPRQRALPPRSMGSRRQGLRCFLLLSPHLHGCGTQRVEPLIICASSSAAWQCCGWLLVGPPVSRPRASCHQRGCLVGHALPVLPSVPLRCGYWLP